MKTIRILTILALAACATALLHAQVPPLLNYQGRVVVNGTNFDGMGQFKFALVDGGTNSAVQATANATITSGFVTSIAIDNPGSGYTSAPAVMIEPMFIGDGGSGATASATVSSGVLLSITVTNAGSGYNSIPRVMIAAPPPAFTYVTYWSNDGLSSAGQEPNMNVFVPVSKGLYSVLLGGPQMNPVTASVFTHSDVRLRVWFADGSHGFQQLAPDQRIASVGYAMVAQEVPDGSITSDKIAAEAIGDSQVGTLSQAKITDLSTDLAAKAMATHAHTAADITDGTLNDTLYGSNVVLANASNTFMTDQAIDGNLAAYTVDTGQGPNELYAMNQNVRTSDIPTFSGLTSTGLVTVQGDLKVRESIGGTYYGTLDVGDLFADTTYTFNGPSGTVMTSGNDGPASGFDADMLDGMQASAFAPASHEHSAQQISTGTLSDARLSSNVALLNQPNTFMSNQTMSGSLRVTWLGVGRNPTGNELEVEGDASKSIAGSWLANSDRRIKQDVRPVIGALETLDKVRLVDFRYTDDYRSKHPAVADRRYLNVIAQDFAGVFPEHVKPSGETLPDGSPILQVDTYPLTIYSAAAVQELHTATKELRKENAELNARLESLEALLMAVPTEKLAGKSSNPPTP